MLHMYWLWIYEKWSDMKDHQRGSNFASFLLTWVLGIALDVLCQWPLQGKSNPCIPDVTWWISLTWHFSRRLEAARQVAAAWSVDDEKVAGWDSRLWKFQQEILGVRQHDESAAFGQSPMDVQRALAVGEGGRSVEEASAQISVCGRILGLFDCDLAGFKVECMGPLFNKAPLPWKTGTLRKEYTRVGEQSFQRQTDRNLNSSYSSSLSPWHQAAKGV